MLDGFKMCGPRKKEHKIVSKVRVSQVSTLLLYIFFSTEFALTTRSMRSPQSNVMRLRSCAHNVVSYFWSC